MKHFPKGQFSAPNWDEDNGAVNDGPVLVETRGYMTLRQQVERALASGVLYEQWKREQFPPEVEVPEDFYPPGYSPDEMDLMMEHQLVVDGRKRAHARVENDERMKKEAAEKAAAEPAPATESIDNT